MVFWKVHTLTAHLKEKGKLIFTTLNNNPRLPRVRPGRAGGERLATLSVPFTQLGALWVPLSSPRFVAGRGVTVPVPRAVPGQPGSLSPTRPGRRGLELEQPREARLSEGIFLQRLESSGSPPTASLRTACTASVVPGRGCGRALWAGSESKNSPSAQVTSFPDRGLFWKRMHLLFICHLFPQRISGIFQSHSTRLVSENSCSLVKGSTSKILNEYNVWSSNSVMEF